MFKSKMSLSLPTNVEHYRVMNAVIAGNIKKNKNATVECKTGGPLISLNNFLNVFS